MSPVQVDKTPVTTDRSKTARGFGILTTCQVDKTLPGREKNRESDGQNKYRKEMLIFSNFFIIFYL